MTTKQIAPIEIAQEGPFIVWRHPYRKGRDLMAVLRGHAARCFVCSEDVPGTKPHTRRELVSKAIIRHICSHDRRKKMRESEGYQRA